MMIMILLMTCLIPARMVHAQHHASLESLLWSDLDDDASQWGIYQDGGTVDGALSSTTTPSLDGSALLVALQGGQPYTGLHAYRNLPQVNPLASQFTLTLSFQFTSLSSIQALEFTMNTWVKDVRWEWAVQWEHIGDGSSQQGTPPTWRLWTGTSWQDIGLVQSLTAGSWHHLRLVDSIEAGHVQYLSFQCDDQVTALSPAFLPVLSSGDKLAVGAQLDGDFQQDPYQMTMENVALLLS
jgi:hypothetical protein